MMAEFHSFYGFSNVTTTYREGVWDEWRAGSMVGGVRPSKKLGYKNFRAALMPIDAHTMGHTTLIGHRDVQSAVGAILVGLHHLINTLR